MTELKNPVCTLCNKTFPKLEVLNDHMKLIHQESPSMRVERLERTIRASLEKTSKNTDGSKCQKSLDCTECGICFINREEQVSHENKYHAKNKSEYICDLCDRIFPNSVERLNHKLFIHTQKK